MKPATDEALPWERQGHETALAFYRFAAYRDLGPTRTLRAAAARLGIGQATIANLATKHKWRARADAWDTHLDKAARDEEIAAVREMRRRHISLGLQLQRASAQGLRILRIAMAADSERINLTQIVQLVRAGTEIERLSRGEPTEIAETRGPPPTTLDLSVLSVEQLRLFRSLIALARGQAPAK